MTGADLPPRRQRRRVGLAARVVLAMLVVATVGALMLEAVGRGVAERKAADLLADQGVDGAVVRLGGPWWKPVVIPALVDGRVEQVTVDLTGTEVAGVQVASARYVLEGLEVTPDWASGSLGAGSMRRGRFDLLLEPAAVGEAMGVEVRTIDGRLVVGPDDEPAKLRVDGEELILESPYLQRVGHPPRVASLSARLLPCEPTVEMVDGLVALGCSSRAIPAVLDRSLGEPVADTPAPPELEPPITAERDGGG